MSRVSQRNTSAEKIISSFLRKSNFRFRKNVKTLPGSPDIVLPKLKTVIFVHGCFWHGHKNCKAAKLPSTRKKFWQEKIEANKSRDSRKNRKLKKLGYKVITVWQCQIKNKVKRDRNLNKLLQKLPRCIG